MNTHQPGTEIAGYRIESVIGHGGMAVVYRAEDTRLGRKVALKLPTPQLADSEQFRQRFIRESRLAASLDHPNIIPIYEAGEADGQLFIAMRYVLGADLKALLAEQGGQLPLERALRLFSQVGSALDAAHRAGLVHRDVKPGNILVTAAERARPPHDDHVYLTDFGLTKRATELSGGLTGTGHFLGTVDYVSPEQIQGRPVGSGTDMYALGCVLYECLTGQLPFRRDDDAALLWAHLVETPAPVSAIRPEVPAAVDAVVARAMAKAPEDRFESCEELLQALEGALRTSAPPPPPPPPPPAPPYAPADRGRRTTATVTDLPGRAQGSMGYSLAIDLGTSFIAAAVADDRGLEMFGLGDGSLVAPAAVYVREDGSLVTGDAAARRAVSRPDRVAREIKRNLGNPTPVMLGGAPYGVTDLLGALLQDVLVRAADRQGAKPEVVALTHPANWGPFRRGLFEDVAQSAGLTDLLYTTEPEAAAAHYASTRPLDEGDVLAVYDLGGGTFDATVLRRTQHGFEIVGTPEGIERLGGADFDDAIFAHVNYLARGALTELDLSDPKTVVALARLRQDCTLAKEALSVDVEATIPVFLPHRHFDVTLTRSDLEGMIRAPIESTIGTLDRVLRAAQIDRTTMAAVLLVGGSSRIPLVAQMVAEAFGRPTVVGAHPKHTVALGAALLAEARRRKVPTALVVGAATRRTATGSVVSDYRPVELVPRGTPQWSPSPAARAPAPVEAGAAPAVTAAAAPALTEAATGGPPVQAPGPRAGGPSGGPPPQGPAPIGPPPTAPRRAGKKWVALVVGLLVVVAAGVFVYLNRQPDDQTAADQSPTASAEAPAPESPPATAVPIPSIGATIPVGETPGFVAAAPNGRHLYVANRTAGVVTVVDTAVDTVTGTIPIDAGPPQFIAFSPDGRRAYVSVWDDERTIAAVSVLDTTTNSVVETIPVDTRPFLSAVSPDGASIYVPNHDTDSVSVIDTATDDLVTNFQVAPNPHWVAFTPDGSKVYTANHDSNVVSAIDPADNTVTAEIPVPTSPHSIAVHPTRPILIVATYDADSASVIDTETDQVLTTIPVGAFPQHAAWSADGRFAYVTNNEGNSISVINGETFAVTATIPTGESPTSFAVLADGSRGYVSNLRDGTLTVLNLAG
ncbi:protein kinase domain-containing protein [Geodermatophilus sabuli]|uniref:non-specific serine/threonine protein kinase n=1 Tax=Geodermatophilus sabuli TaxID=1564158 RepID=A0A285EEL1_9ACTN|nr:Hsp70 family protein [Geodermatophilus sabuli]MBB3086234.1 YVTN family beta-propeller protein [Geodermatophilus sabuli]SNX97549.1 40-residue YVTN family beta-propeller repeat-containing protein [Geodermatophilus sabuli]